MGWFKAADSSSGLATGEVKTNGGVDVGFGVGSLPKEYMFDGGGGPRTEDCPSTSLNGKICSSNKTC